MTRNNPDNFAYAPNRDDPSTWILPLVNTYGKVTPQTISAAVASITNKGLGGAKIPTQDLPSVALKIRKAWLEVHPKAKPGDMPTVLKEVSQMTLEQLEDKVAKLDKDLEAANAKAAEHETTAAEATKRAERADVLLGLSDENREVFKAFSEERQEEFYSASAEGRTEILEAAKNDPEPEDVPAEVQKRLDDIAKRLEESETENARLASVAKAAEDRAELQELAKKAETDYPALPGDPTDKALILKAMKDMDEDAKKALETCLSAGNEALAATLKPVGVRKSADPEGAGDWENIEKKAKELAQEKGISIAKATDELLVKNPELYKSYLENRVG